MGDMNNMMRIPPNGMQMPPINPGLMNPGITY